MNALRLEELEQRDLLNAYMAVPPRTSFAGHTSSTSGMELPALSNYRSDGNDSLASPIAAASPRMNDGSPVVIVETVEIVVINIRMEPSHQSPYTDGSNSNASDTGNVAVDPPTKPVDRTPAATSRETVTDAATTAVNASAAISRAVIPQTTPFAFGPQANPAAAAIPPLVAPLPLALGRTADGMALAVPAPAQPLATPAGGGAQAAVPESAEPPLAPEETPAAAPVLAPLATIDMASLGRGLGQFLHQIEKVGEELVGDGDGLRPWLIAGAAAATACEIARRQLRRAAEFAPIRINDARFDRPYID
jgi:hypothetical protein